MIVSKCPMRISFAGGGSDLDEYRKQFGESAIVSFSPNLYTYVSVFRDLFGQNSARNLFNVHYSKVELTPDVSELKNDIVRTCAEYFESKPFSCWFTSDIPSHGSGLANSSSYMLAMVQALTSLECRKLSKNQVIELSWKLERCFNEHTGFQDPYGCSLGGVNFIQKTGDEEVVYEKIDDSLLRQFNMFLVPTNVSRSSTDVLSKSKTWSFTKRLHETAHDMKQALNTKNKQLFIDICKEVWELKKSTTPDILSCKELVNFDDKLSESKSILAHRLIGAGSGGYFFILTENSATQEELERDLQCSIRQVRIDSQGLRSTEIL